MATDFINSLQNTITGTNDPEQIDGTPDNDNINGLGGDDIINGFSGNDLLVGGDGNDNIHGGEGNDWIAGLAGENSLYGEGGHDWIQIGTDSWNQSGPDMNVVNGGDGSDVVDRENFASNSTIYGGSNNADAERGGFNGDILRYRDIVNYVDAISFESGVYQITTSDGYTDRVSNIEYLAFGANDSVYGYEALVKLDDLALFLGDLDNNVIETSQTQFSTVIAGAGDDQITGGDLGHWISGGKGNDTISTGNGVDYIYTGDGIDTVNSGDGDDAIISSGTGNTIISGNGNDLIVASDSTIHATSGDEVVIGLNNTIKFNYSIKDVLNFSSTIFDFYALPALLTYKAQVNSNTFPFFIKPGPVGELLIQSNTIQTPVGSVFFSEGMTLEFNDFKFNYDGFVLEDNTSNGVRLHLSDSDSGSEEDDLYFNVSIDSFVDGMGGIDKVRLAINSNELTNVEQNQQGQVEVTSTTGTIRLVNVEQIVFSNGKKITVEKLLEHFTTSASADDLPFADETFSFYEGNVNYLEYQYLGLSTSDITIGSSNNDFINLLGGDDAADGSAGRDVLDGGTGSNFLTGGDGADIFFLDGRGGTTTWSTITDFSDGDNVNIWGWQEGVSKLIQSVNNAGAEGYKGATFHYDLDNDGAIDTSITFSGLTTDQVPASSAQEVAGNGYLLFA